MSRKTDVHLPRGIGAPATRALTAAGYSHLAQLDGVPADGLAQLHGVGPKALKVLQDALEQRGMSLA
jgi:predicted flap endonuclease-1-like 5' DNA nuclease